jgi:uncharacterized membrane protein
MTYQVAADAVVVLHFAFVVFVVIGGVLALRWPKVLWLHVPAVLYSAWIITFSITCPLRGPRVDATGRIRRCRSSRSRPRGE